MLHQEDKKYYSFAGGPTMMPRSVLQQLRGNFMHDKELGVALLDLNPHSKEFRQVHRQAEELVRDLMEVPPHYRVWFCPAGAHLQFGAFPLNLLNGSATANYTCTGYFSRLSVEEAQKVCKVNRIATLQKDVDGKLYIPDEYSYQKDSGYTHYVENETVEGLEYSAKPMPYREGDILLTDCSSNFLTRPIDWQKISMAYAHTQKNCGISGSTIMIVHEKLIEMPKLHNTPTVCDYRQYKQGYPSTPIVIPIYMNRLLLKYVKQQGGPRFYNEHCRTRSNKLYDVIDGSHGFYNGVARKDWRSRINVTWRMETQQLTQKCIAEAAENGLLEIKGHRSAGGFRASLFLPVPDEGIDCLADFLRDFHTKHQ